MSATAIGDTSPTTQATVRVATAIKELMVRYGLVQADLQQALTLSQTAVSKRLRGTTPFDVNELDVVAHYFGLTLAELVSLADQPRPPGPVSGRVRAVNHEYLDVPDPDLLALWRATAEAMQPHAPQLSQSSLVPAA